MTAESRLVRVYIMGYSPPCWDMDDAAENGGIERIMDKTDMCFTVGNGEPWPIGVTITPGIQFEVGHGGSSPTLEIGQPYRCVRHEYAGKIAIVEPVPTKDPESAPS